MENETPVLLYDMFGKTVNNSSIPKGEWKTDLSVTDLPDGIYVVRVGTGALINATKVRVRHQQ
jgi:type IX secretion system substrate protein